MVQCTERAETLLLFHYFISALYKCKSPAEYGLQHDLTPSPLPTHRGNKKFTDYGGKLEQIFARAHTVSNVLGEHGYTVNDMGNL
jgi:hypothetical protein